MLTFYNERIANESFLGTALLPESVQPARAAARLPSATRNRGDGDARRDRREPRPRSCCRTGFAVVVEGEARASSHRRSRPPRASRSPSRRARRRHRPRGPGHDRGAGGRPAVGAPHRDGRAASPRAADRPRRRAGQGHAVVDRVGDRLLLSREPWSTRTSRRWWSGDRHGGGEGRRTAASRTRGCCWRAEARRCRQRQGRGLPAAPRRHTPRTCPRAVRGQRGGRVETRRWSSTAPRATSRPATRCWSSCPGAGVGGSPGSGFDVVRLTSTPRCSGTPTPPPRTRRTPPAGGVPASRCVVAKLTRAGAQPGASLHRRLRLAAPARSAVHSGWTDVGTLLDTPVSRSAALPGKLTLARPPAAAAGGGQARRSSRTPAATAQRHRDPGGWLGVTSPSAAPAPPCRRRCGSCGTWSPSAAARRSATRSSDAATRPQAGQDFALSKLAGDLSSPTAPEGGLALR